MHPTRLNLLVGATIFLSKASFTRIQEQGYRYVVFQSEVLDEQYGFLQRCGAYLDFLLKAPQVWDFSARNLAFLETRGYSRAHYIPLGYSRHLERIIPAKLPDIDVLFYGSLSPRRKRVLKALNSYGVRTIALIGNYGRERDEAIARSQIVLNLHQFDTPHLEQLRISYLLNNHRFVVSEISDSNPYGAGVVFSDYDNIVDSCLSFLGPEKEEARAQIANEGHRRLRSLPMLSVLSALLEQFSCQE